MLLLDEPTAALDNESEERIRLAIEALRREKTVIIIAHRLTTLHHCNTILVLDDGVICEQGTHEELMKRNGRYVALYRALGQDDRADGSTEVDIGSNGQDGAPLDERAG